MEKNLTDLYRRGLALSGELKNYDKKLSSWCFLDGDGTFVVFLYDNFEPIFRERIHDILNNIEAGYTTLQTARDFAKKHVAESRNAEVKEIEFGPLISLDKVLTQIMGR
jgi:hypothetical protein